MIRHATLVSVPLFLLLGLALTNDATVPGDHRPFPVGIGTEISRHDPTSSDLALKRRAVDCGPCVSFSSVCISTSPTNCSNYVRTALCSSSQLTLYTTCLYVVFGMTSASTVEFLNEINQICGFSDSFLDSKGCGTYYTKYGGWSSVYCPASSASASAVASASLSATISNAVASSTASISTTPTSSSGPALSSQGTPSSSAPVYVSSSIPLPPAPSSANANAPPASTNPSTIQGGSAAPSDSSTPVAAIAGGVVGGVVVLGVAGVVAVLMNRRRRNEPKPKSNPDVSAPLASNTTPSYPPSPAPAPASAQLPSAADASTQLIGDVQGPPPSTGLAQPQPYSEYGGPPPHSSPYVNFNSFSWMVPGAAMSAGTLGSVTTTAFTDSTAIQSTKLYQQLGGSPGGQGVVVNVQAAALFSYTPSAPDELYVDKGDIIFCDTLFPDDWCTGKNINRGSRGIFPVAILGPSPFGIDGNADVSKISPRGASVMLSTRALQ
ncbi:hypothetical protein M427DRAFT_159579 [Gonapodya prolifera JEL478]|uniref:SH3 domain-containing protein n=1 Tax=Gonapodya prolifera (strain JEL478) TaxID=1344416 RepID=A0A139A0B5_GONPJ|nr:hypothetical protein M427DRAFT_159579 [Gonapodya prolifera JEL478]|eukprot:KXS10226.1 hypothetical protein M427DRAFT_159579 [Gonapodya prolifera JEL478]